MVASDLLERSEQQAAIASALRSSRQGDGCVLVIEGAAGIGKSRLLQELRQAAPEGQLVLSARASELERGFAFGVVRQLFEAIVRDPDLGPAALEGAARAAGDIFEETPSESRAASFALLHGLHWLVLNLAEVQPIVLAIDDLHWCDASSLRFLAYLGRRLEGTPILIAAATRPIAPATADAELLSELLAEPTAIHLYPKALSEHATAELLSAQVDGPVDPGFAEACFDATDGNPLMLRQLARSIQAEGTAPTAANAANVRRAAHRALARTVLARVGRYSADAIAVARAVAVLGDTANGALIASVAEIDGAAVGPAWRELVEAEVLRRDELAFVHALVRDAIYFDLPEPDRQTLHLRAAKQLEAAGERVERIAGQLELVPLRADAWVANIAEQAGRAALRRGATDAAAIHLRRALEEPAPPDRLQAIKRTLAEVLFDVDAPSAIDLFRELATDEQDVRERALIQIGLTQALALTDRWSESATISQQAQQQLGPEHEDLSAIFDSIRTTSTMFGADDGAALRSMDDHRVLPPNAPLGVRLRAGLASLVWTYDGGSAEVCADLAERAVASDPTILRDNTLIAVAPLYVLGLADREEGLDLWERARADAHRSGSTVLHLSADMWLGFTQQRRGDLTDAIAGLTNALGLMRSWGSGKEPMRYARSALALAHLDAGDVRQARIALDDGPPASHERPSLGNALWWHAQSWVLFAEGRHEEALAATATLEHRSAWMKHPVGSDWRLPRALAQHRLGHAEAALETAIDGVRIAEQWGAAGVLGPALRILGEVKGDAGLDEVRRSVSILESSPARIQLTRSLLALGGLLRRGRQPTLAREPLERAYELAGACGSPGLVDQVRTELAATGVRRKPGDVAGPGALTPSERRVADLAAGGRTNREIAQELFVTPKTVEVHLSAAYRKLGISSRHALVGALTGAGAA